MTPIEQAIAEVDRILCDARETRSGSVIVRAVLAEIREPSEAMRKAIDPNVDAPWWFEDAVVGAWQAMIDAAIAE